MKERFAYSECLNCGALQLNDVPPALDKYYPTHYWSPTLQKPNPESSWPSRALAVCRNRGVLFGHNPLSWLLNYMRPRPDFTAIATLLAPIKLTRLDLNVLDVGCGAGEHLETMANLGFSRLTGLDPFADPGIHHGRSHRLLTRTIEQVEDGPYDLIMSHHSLEHVAGQVQMLRHMNRLLAPNGTIIVRMPIASSAEFYQYRENWVELDPPRHLFVHSYKSFQLVAAAAGLQVQHTQCDSDGFGYWGSELYKRGIPLYTQSEGRFLRPNEVFNDSELARFRKQAADDNARGVGGRGAFYLRKA